MSLFTECGILDTNWAGETQALQTGLDAENVPWDLVPWVAPHTHSVFLPAVNSDWA